MSQTRLTLRWPITFWVVADMYLFFIGSHFLLRGFVFAALPAIYILGILTGAWAGWLQTRGGREGWAGAVLAGVYTGAVAGGGWLLLFGPALGIRLVDILPYSILLFSMVLLGALAGGWATVSMAPPRPRLGPDKTVTAKSGPGMKDI